MREPCLTFEEIMSKRLDDYEYRILEKLCTEPERGVESSKLQKSVGVDKVTFYKRLQRLTEELEMVERLPYTSTGVKDRRRVYYRVRPECQALCSELVAGFEIRQFLAKTSFQSLDPKELGSGRTIGIGLEHPVIMTVFSNKELDPSFLCRKFENREFKELVPKVIGDMFKSLFKGFDNKDEACIAIVLMYPIVKGE